MRAGVGGRGAMIGQAAPDAQRLLASWAAPVVQVVLVVLAAAAGLMGQLLVSLQLVHPVLAPRILSPGFGGISLGPILACRW